MTTTVTSALVGPRVSFRGRFPVARVRTLCVLSGLEVTRTWSSLQILRVRGSRRVIQSLEDTGLFVVDWL